MKKRMINQSFLVVFFLALVFIFVTAQYSVAEMTLNDNVNIEGDLFLEGNNSGISYSDGSRQTTAATPSWHQILPAADRFELVMYVNLLRGFEAVLDRETGLVWQRNTSDTLYNWEDANVFCHQTEIGGRKGWRLPTIEELSTLIDPFRTNPSVPDNHPFTNVKNDCYWSSATYSGSTSNAWLVYFSNGAVYVGIKTDSYYVRAVRSGQ